VGTTTENSAAVRHSETVPCADVGWSAGLWAIWAVLTGLVFTLIDWRQTKHLIILVIPAILALAVWMRRGRRIRGVAVVILATILIWNLGELWLLGEVFSDFRVTPAW